MSNLIYPTAVSECHRLLVGAVESTDGSGASGTGYGLGYVETPPGPWVVGLRLWTHYDTAWVSQPDVALTAGASLVYQATNPYSGAIESCHVRDLLGTRNTWLSWPTGGLNGLAVDFETSWPTADARTFPARAWQAGHRRASPRIEIGVCMQITNAGESPERPEILSVDAAVSLSPVEGVTEAQWQEALQHWRVAWTPGTCTVVLQALT